MGEVVRRHCHADAIAGQHANVMASHTTGQLGAHQRPTLIHLDRVLATAESVLNDAIHLQQVAFTHTIAKQFYEAVSGAEPGTIRPLSQGHGRHQIQPEQPIFCALTRISSIQTSDRLGVGWYCQMPNDRCSNWGAFWPS